MVGCEITLLLKNNIYTNVLQLCKKNVNILGTVPGRISDHSGWKMFSGDITIFNCVIILFLLLI